MTALQLLALLPHSTFCWVLSVWSLFVLRVHVGTPASSHSPRTVHIGLSDNFNLSTDVSAIVNVCLFLHVALRSAEASSNFVTLCLRDGWTETLMQSTRTEHSFWCCGTPVNAIFIPSQFKGTVLNQPWHYTSSNVSTSQSILLWVSKGGGGE